MKNAPTFLFNYVEVVSLVSKIICYYNQCEKVHGYNDCIKGIKTLQDYRKFLFGLPTATFIIIKQFRSVEVRSAKYKIQQIIKVIKIYFKSNNAKGRYLHQINFLNQTLYIYSSNLYYLFQIIKALRSRDNYQVFNYIYRQIVNRLINGQISLKLIQKLIKEIISSQDQYIIYKQCLMHQYINIICNICKLAYPPKIFQLHLLMLLVQKLGKYCALYFNIINLFQKVQQQKNKQK
eukprot:TRINITY_DN2813_c2_g4_i2.p2 TRINITY_DN2813_c2_g4~~TRINITY_DN2813_c2_g4_i2.p2  ORF type:complete len:235 (-),score=-19.39 TRINITY_DN2813_c2_g4_i2:117-821(-)